jgi:NTE family protein
MAGLEREHGIHVDYISPINEPDGHWNWQGPKQEGSPATNREIARLAKALNSQLDNSQLTINDSQSSSVRNSSPSGRSGEVSFACVASDLPSFSEVVLTGDSLARNMRASMAIPALFKAVRFDDYVLYDGGIFNNLPVDVARQLGATKVIAVDLTVNHPDDDDDAPSEFVQLLDDLLGLSSADGIVGWLFNRPDFKKYRKNCKDADVYINPPLYEYDATDFGRKAISEMIFLGEHEARKQMEALRSFR